MDLPVFEAVKPVGTCGACGTELFPHSTPNQCNYRKDCPLHGDKWRDYQSARRMQNWWNAGQQQQQD
jgi:hypothetical protein